MVHECFGPLLVFAHTIDNGQCPSSVDLPPNMNSLISETHVADNLYSQAIDGLTLWQSLFLTLWMLVIFFHFYCYLSWWKNLLNNCNIRMEKSSFPF
jgi:hypothetical protein